MNALGQHVLIRKPAKQTAEGVILLPDNYEKTFAYGRVVSVGPRAAEICPPVSYQEGGELKQKWLEDGDLVVFDHFGAREITLDGKKDAELVCAHASQLYSIISEAELEARRCPIPK